MRRACVTLLAALLLMLPVSLRDGSIVVSAAQNGASPKLIFEGEMALWTVAVKPDKTGDFEKVMMKLRDALMKSEKPERNQQAAGWKVMRVSKPLPDGNVAFVHIVNPVVPGADYSVMQALYDEFPDERQDLYDLYRGAFVQNLSLLVGDLALDLSKPLKDGPLSGQPASNAGISSTLK